MTGSAPLPWRQATADDLDGIGLIGRIVHPALPERAAVYADKLAHSPATCFVLAAGDRLSGYGLAHPWVLDSVPALDTMLGVPDRPPDTLYIHDVALLPEARASGAGRALVQRLVEKAWRLALPRLALVSVYGTGPIWSRLGFRERRTAAVSLQLGSYGDEARYMVLDLLPLTLDALD